MGHSANTFKQVQLQKKSDESAYDPSLSIWFYEKKLRHL